ncbi:MAG: 30S ribosomal protein THX [Cyclobacteriaceae bacterium]|jgi:ribosomal small subunit protein bTHX|nr:30S ribosomal protein THX [Cyclobacteriaceae bacterium]
MGKGDKKSKKGKQWRGSYGISRNRNSIKTRIKRAASKKVTAPKAEEKAAKPKKTSRKKAE